MRVASACLTHDMPARCTVVSVSVSMRVRQMFGALYAYVRSAPGTFVWLAILLVTTLIIRSVPADTAQDILERRSTNLHYLSVSPVRVLVSSALWIGGSGWFGYLVLYNIFHVPAERWLGTRRWLGVVVIAHGGATFLSEGVLYWAIHHGYAPHSAVHTLDYGVSYALAGVEGVLTYLIARPWRFLYVGALLLYYIVGVLQARDFTSVGHLSAALIGLACYPIARGRPGQWDPAASARMLRQRLRRA